MSHLQITILSSHQWFTASFILPNVQPLISSRMWIPAKPKTFSQPNGVHGFIEFCTTMCRNNAVCVMKGPVSTNVGMSSQTIFISTLSLILNSDKDPRSHKDFISSDDLFSELLIDHLVWTHCVKVKHTHGCSPRQSCDHIGHQSKDWTARDVNQNSVRTYQVTGSPKYEN